MSVLYIKKHTSDWTQLFNTHGKIILNIWNFVIPMKFYYHNPCQQLFIKSSGKLFHASRDNIFRIKVIADIGVLSKMSVLLLLTLEIKTTMLQPIKLWFCIVYSKEYIVRILQFTVCNHHNMVRYYIFSYI